VAGYGQFCPIAQAAEVLTERWTPLVIGELVLATVGVDLCLTDPGYGADLAVRSDPVVLAAG
jgi:hypothetical protein